MSNIPYTKHLRYPGPDFMRNQAPLIAGSANATQDELSELALMGHQLKLGIQLRVGRPEYDWFVKTPTSIPFNEVVWPARTIELYIDKALEPTILGGIMSSDDIKAMGFQYWRETHERSLHILIQERKEAVTLQCRYLPAEVEHMATILHDDLAIAAFHAEYGFNLEESIALGRAAVYLYKAAAFTNEGFFHKFACNPRQYPGSDGERNRPHTDRFTLSIPVDEMAILAERPDIRILPGGIGVTVANLEGVTKVQFDNTGDNNVKWFHNPDGSVTGTDSTGCSWTHHVDEEIEISVADPDAVVKVTYEATPDPDYDSGLVNLPREESTNRIQ